MGAQFCYDGQPGTGWSTTDQPGRPHEAVFNFAQPVDLAGDAVLKMLFERHYSCGLGRFRISVTTAARKAEASSHGSAITAILVKPTEQRTPAEREQLRQRYLEVAPELANARKEIEKLRAALPAYQLTMVMKERPADR